MWRKNRKVFFFFVRTEPSLSHLLLGHLHSNCFISPSTVSNNFSVLVLGEIVAVLLSSSTLFFSHTYATLSGLRSAICTSWNDVFFSLSPLPFYPYSILPQTVLLQGPIVRLAVTHNFGNKLNQGKII